MNSFYTFALVIIAFWVGRRTSHIALIDIAAAIVAQRAPLKACIRSILDCCCDFSGQSIPLPGRGCFFVTWAATSTEKRAVVWLYQSFDTPDQYDWRECLKRYGLTRIPAHTLKWTSHTGDITTAAVTIDLAAGKYSVLRTTGNGVITAVEGDIVIWALTTSKLLGCR
jgi:hypothetical protein